MKPILIGEQNPYGGHPDFALYPCPDGSAGHRLCCLILGMSRKAYLEAFVRRNLCAGKWSMREARANAASILENDSGRAILLGAKVSAAFGVPFVPFSICELGTVLILPHPSGRNLLWNVAGAIQAARQAVADFLPELAELLGKVES
jgi:hypothetical protein